MNKEKREQLLKELKDCRAQLFDMEPSKQEQETRTEQLASMLFHNQPNSNNKNISNPVLSKALPQFKKYMDDSAFIHPLLLAMLSFFFETIFLFLGFLLMK